MNETVREVTDKVIELLKDVPFPWFFMAECVDIHEIVTLSYITNVDTESPPRGNTQIEDIFRYIEDEYFNDEDDEGTEIPYEK